ncbi:hypothetical protein Bca52824_018087 [Brassica carinata]|uniref:Uncharacterized protein n=1 Tax=Brassica carinata TaxID=52824 RepID=A0A8X8AX25_BRACI|nr:hypothetical protein Bca52824_018087 [Brassica carinata]
MVRGTGLSTPLTSSSMLQFKSANDLLVNYLAKSEGGGVPLPSGGILTPNGLQSLGLSGLGSSTGFERLLTCWREYGSLF